MSRHPAPDPSPAGPSTFAPTPDEYKVLAERLEHIRFLAGDADTPERDAERRRGVIATLKREREDDALRGPSRF